MTARTPPRAPLVPFKRGPGVATLMGRVRQAKTAPEETVAAWLRAHGLGNRRNVRRLPGRPDFANQRMGFAIFAHGCFWHRKPGWPRTTRSTRNRDFWVEFDANVARDMKRSADLEATGLRRLTIWECEVENAAVRAQRLAPLLELRSREQPQRRAAGRHA